MSSQTGTSHADSPFSIQLETYRGVLEYLVKQALVDSSFSIQLETYRSALECLVKQALVDSPFSIQLENYRGALECLGKQVRNMLITPLASNLRPTEVPWNV